MAIVKTSRKLEIGDEIIPWANSEEEHDRFMKKVEEAKKEIKALPEGGKHLIFLMRKKYKESHPQNTSILYKRSVKGFYPASGAPDYKDHFLKFNWGMIKTSNFEEIAYLDIHSNNFVREANRELTPMEKLEKENKELKEKLEAQKKEEEKIKEKEEMDAKIDELAAKYDKRKVSSLKQQRTKSNGSKSGVNAGEEQTTESPDIGK